MWMEGVIQKVEELLNIGLYESAYVLVSQKLNFDVIPYFCVASLQFSGHSNLQASFVISDAHIEQKNHAKEKAVVISFDFEAFYVVISTF